MNERTTGGGAEKLGPGYYWARYAGKAWEPVRYWPLSTSKPLNTTRGSVSLENWELGPRLKPPMLPIDNK